MKIALLSYEFPPDTADGGIATYVAQLSSALQRRGHEVEVFAGSTTRTESVVEASGVRVHRVRVSERLGDEGFGPAIAPIYADRHAAVGFDVVEGPDLFAEAAEAVTLTPDVPRVVMLHTSKALLTHLRLEHRAVAARTGIGALVSRLIHRPRHDPWMAQLERKERIHAATADGIVAPSDAIRRATAGMWGIGIDRIDVVPLPFSPSAAMLALEPGQGDLVVYVGRLELRKGVVDLARAIPAIRRAVPSARFAFVGSSCDSPDPRRDMLTYLRDLLGTHSSAVDFVGSVGHAALPAIFARAAVSVVPSVWENFPYVCLEAMSAGRAVVGSNTGGIPEMMPTPDVGSLVPPRTPVAIAEAVIALLRDPTRRARVGAAARARVRREYSPDVIAARREASYVKAIARRHKIQHAPVYSSPSVVVLGGTGR